MAVNKKCFVISCVIFPYDVMILFNLQYPDLEKTLKRHLPIDVHNEIKAFDSDYDATTVLFSTGQTCIHFRKKTAGVVAHEIFHAVHFILDRLGMKLTVESGEAYAYLIQYLTNEVYKIKK